MRSLGAALILALFAALVAGCSEEKSACAEACVEPARCNEATGLCDASCSADGDCGAAHLRCMGGTCMPRCAGVICGGGSYCEPTTGECLDDIGDPCDRDADCDDQSRRCEAGVCVPKCRNVRCNEEAGELCNPTTGECVGGSACSTTADCRPDEVCQGELCVGARLSSCDGGRPCAAGLSCIGNGQFSLCTERCSITADCAITERCGGEDAGGFSGACLPNLCRPGGDTMGFYQDAQFLGACNAASTGDGICVGPFASADGESGICVGSGGAGDGASCAASASHGDANACAGGWCVGTEDDGVGNCLPFCGPALEESCPVIGPFETECRPLWGDNGLCVPKGQ